MKLVDAASYFDLTPATDPDTGVLLFKGQIDPFDDAKRDGTASYRRILSVRPGTAIPAGRVITMLGKTWLVGTMEPDGLQELHRQKYVLQEAAKTVKVSRLSGFLAGTVVSTLRANVAWYKDEDQVDVSSQMPQLFDIMLPSGSVVQDQDILWNTGEAYLVLSKWDSVAGFFELDCLKLDQVLPVAANLTTRTYVPTTGLYTTSAATTVNALSVRWQNLFKYVSQASEKNKPGDVAIVLPTGTAASNSTLVTLSGLTYQTLAVLDIAGAVVLHARLV